MELSQCGLTILKELEGCSYVVYKDIAGITSIGYGHALTKSEFLSGKIRVGAQEFVSYREVSLNDEQIEKILKYDLLSVESLLSGHAIKVPLNQHQFDALCLFVFNVGIGGFLGSTLLKQLNSSMYSIIPVQLQRWNRAGGKVIKGLTNRRKKEIELWNIV